MEDEKEQIPTNQVKKKTKKKKEKEKNRINTYIKFWRIRPFKYRKSNYEKFF